MRAQKNYQKMLEATIAGLKEQNRVPTLLLHSCCGPCSSYVLEYLTQYFYIKLFFCNPNIQPSEEYNKRLEEQKKIIDRMKLADCVELIEGEYNSADFLSEVKGLESEPEGGKRCEVCIKMRMAEAAKAAKLYNAEYFATTLTVSPQIGRAHV